VKSFFKAILVIIGVLLISHFAKTWLYIASEFVLKMPIDTLGNLIFAGFLFISVYFSWMVFFASCSMVVQLSPIVGVLTGITTLALWYWA
jgi:hypothetical protein